MKKPITVSIGIPAYNEEINIRQLINALLSQKQKGYKLFEIIVISDGSTDRTIEILKSSKKPMLKVIESKKRLGQQIRQNQIIDAHNGEILIIIEADTLPENENTISELIKPFTEKSINNLAMVVGQAVSVEPTNYFEKIMLFGELLKRDIFLEWNNGSNLYVTGGHGMKAISRKFSRKLRWPKDVPEDTYTYLRLKELNLRMVKQFTARAYVKLVSNFEDSFKQNVKFVAGKKSLMKYFPRAFIEKEFKVPKYLIIKHIIFSFFKEPFLTILFLVQAVINRLKSKKAEAFTELYEPYWSSKSLGTIWTYEEA